MRTEKKAYKLSKSKMGFTLIELLVALAIMSIVFGAIYAAFFLSILRCTTEWDDLVRDCGKTRRKFKRRADTESAHFWQRRDLKEAQEFVFLRELDSVCEAHAFIRAGVILGVVVAAFAVSSLQRRASAFVPMSMRAAPGQ